MDYATAAELVREEMARATEKFGPFRSDHEGYAILLEEVDELWTEVKFNPTSETGKVGKEKRLKQEAVQVAAMALRFLIDRC